MRKETQAFREMLGLDELDGIIETGKLVAIKEAMKREEKKRYATKKLQNSRRDNQDLS